MLAFQRVELDRLLAFARASSPYYREVLPGGGDVPLADLPVLTKSVLMEQWDRISTSPGLQLAQLEGRLAQMERTGADPGHPWRGRWWLAGTGGTTGRRAVFAWDRQEWTQILTSYARVNDWAGGRGRSAPPASHGGRELPQPDPPVRCGGGESALAPCSGATTGRADSGG